MRCTLLVLMLGVQWSVTEDTASARETSNPADPAGVPLFRMVFGSCMHQHKTPDTGSGTGVGTLKSMVDLQPDVLALIG